MNRPFLESLNDTLGIFEALRQSNCFLHHILLTNLVDCGTLIMWSFDIDNFVSIAFDVV